MNTTSDTVLEEVWTAKDRLSANSGHNLAATCRAIYTEQAENPGRFLVLGKSAKARQGGVGQSASHSESKPEGNEESQTELEGRPR
jgi:hypothetical protein